MCDVRCLVFAVCCLLFAVAVSTATAHTAIAHWHIAIAIVIVIADVIASCLFLFGLLSSARAAPFFFFLIGN
jgi:hypothetical protein